MRERMHRNLLIVTPHFPPVNAPDMQRVRMSLPFFEEFGWTPHVLAVSPSGHEVVEPLLNETLPPHVAIERVPSLSPDVARRFGFGNVALRAMPYLYAAGSRLLREKAIDLVYFSTTMFLTMPLGRLWKRRFGVPYVLDLQDPWLSDYYETHPDVAPPPKYSMARRANAVLEPWTMKTADGIVAVSPDYIGTLQRRYPWLRDVPCATLPFGASAADFEVIEKHPQLNAHFDSADGRLHGVYAGRGGDDLAISVDILCRAFRQNLVEDTEFARMDLHFIGTDYATDGRARATIAPRAAAVGLGAAFHEDPARVPYFRALQLLHDAHFLLVLGSDDASYTASKIYPYILSGKPILAVVHEGSPLVRLLHETKAAAVVTFPSHPSETLRAAVAARAAGLWRTLIASRHLAPDTDWQKFESYSARAMTGRQCALFDQVVSNRAAAAA